MTAGKRSRQTCTLNPTPPTQPQAPGQVSTAAPSPPPLGCVYLAPSCVWFLVTRRGAATALAVLAPNADERTVCTWLGLAWRRYLRWLAGLLAGR